MLEWTAVKKGWVYQKERRSLLLGRATWTAKYLVLYAQPCASIALYEQRSDAMPPYAPLLHVELANGVVVAKTGSAGPAGGLGRLGKKIAERLKEVIRPGGTGSGTTSRASTRPPLSLTKVVSENESNEDHVFIVTRPAGDNQSVLKIMMAASSKAERDDWLSAISELIAASNANEIGHDTSAADPVIEMAPINPINLVEKHTPNEASGISCLGVTIMERRRLLGSSSGFGQRSASNNAAFSRSLSDLIEKAQAMPASAPPLEEDAIERFAQLQYSRRHGSSPDDRLRAGLEILKVMGKVHDYAVYHVRTLIDNFHINNMTKLASSNDSMNGVYEHGLLRLQFIADYRADAGDNGRLVEAARKAVGAELRATRMINGQAKVDAEAGFMTLIDYKGFRVLAYLAAQTTEESLILDVCGNNAKVDRKALKTIEELAAVFNLSQGYGWRMMNGQQIDMSLHPSILAHRLNGRIYLSNLEDMLPLLPTEETQRFRPEFLKSLPNPLTIGPNSPDSERTTSARRRLYEDAIEYLANRLDALDILPSDSRDWTAALHTHGINCSLLGRLLSKTRLPHAREGLLIEILARTLKPILHEKLRDTILHFRNVQALRVEDELRQIVLTTINNVMLGAKTGNSWIKELCERAKGRFEGGSSEISADNVRHIHLNALFVAITYHCGLIFADRQYDFDSIKANLELIDRDDLVDFAARVGEGPMVLDPQLYDPAYDETVLLANESLAIGNFAQTPLNRAHEARILTHLAKKHMESGNCDVAKTHIMYARALAPAGHAVNAEILMQNAALLIRNSRDVKAMADVKRAYLSALGKVEMHLGPHHPQLIVVHERMAQLLCDGGSSEEEEALLVLHQALSTALKVLGRSHNWTLRLLLKIANCHGVLGHHDEALRLFREALPFVVGDEVKKAEIVEQMAKQMEEKGEFGEALRTMQECARIRESSPRLGPKHFLTLSTLPLIANLAQRLYSSEHENDFVSGMVTEEMTSAYQLALECYERLFRAQQHGLLAQGDSTSIVVWLRKMVILRLKLATASQKLVLKSLLNSGPNTSICSIEDPEMMRQLVLRMVTGTTPARYVEGLLGRCVSGGDGGMAAEGSADRDEARVELAAILKLIGDEAMATEE